MSDGQRNDEQGSPQHQSVLAKQFTEWPYDQPKCVCDGSGDVHRKYCPMNIVYKERLMSVQPVTESAEQEVNPPEQGAISPAYYSSNAGDVYAMLIAQFGLDAWLRHAEMEVIQYMFRATRKQNYLGDVKKAKVIVDRIIAEMGG